jgi:D-serine deaminase-like pyridoxal phosphate-dependent protein
MAELPATLTERAATIYRGVADVLATEPTAKRSKRRKLWE